ncbi:hypothetical protein ABE65_010405 [Fictibacillus phosphorivorans]|uniref:Uncharacterized protein n=1 Tax=Fictibacillus phosphorivorans TaxID=1221500 RepID=A0A160IM10_9BACL|nr:hypothetical protein [Fictibacillus phosphorivorans]ANC77191.1 hypothetical protein ABE65_010405 [Fictibacillus phosphorivorans]
MKTIFEVLGYIASVSVLSGVLLFSIRALIKSKINSYFSTALENHKHDLSLIAEHTRFDYQRKIHDFGLYSSKRHEYYPELYGLILRMHRNIRSFYFHSTVPTGLLLSKNVFTDYLSKFKISAERIDLILHLWEKGPDSLEEIKKQIKDAKLLEIFEEVNIANDYCFNYDLFFSERVSNLLEEIFLNVYRLMEIIKKEQDDYTEEDGQYIHSNYEKLIELKNVIKDELSKGHYDNKL